MKLRFLPILLSVVIFAFPTINAEFIQVNADDTFTVTFFDFDGNVMNTQQLKNGETIDYSLPDTSSLKSNINTFTQRMFSSWDIQPETATADTEIHALYKEAVISLDSIPSKTVYSIDDDELDPSGLSVVITISTQTSNVDDNGNRIMTVEKTDISSKCTLSPDNVKEAFANSDTAEIKIYPIASNVPVGSYTINLDMLKGDVNFDGSIDATDASIILEHYASYSLGVNDAFTKNQKWASDVNNDGKINALDASSVLKYYSDSSKGLTPSWN